MKNIRENELRALRDGSLCVNWEKIDPDVLRNIESVSILGRRNKVPKEFLKSCENMKFLRYECIHDWMMEMEIHPKIEHIYVFPQETITKTLVDFLKH